MGEAEAGSSFLGRVRSRMRNLPPAERRLAAFVIEFPGDIASYTATELARLANVSNATVTRFVRSVGYDSFEQARQQVRAERGSGAALYLVSGASPGKDPTQAHATQAQANIARTFAGLAPGEIDEIAQAMLSARRVWVIGFRGGQALAGYFQWQALQVLPTVTLAPGAGQTLAEHLADAGPQDAALVVGLLRRARATDAALAHLVAAGAAVAYLTDEPTPPPTAPRWRLRCQTTAPGPLFNHAAPLAALHLLATRLIELSGADGRRRLAAIESAHDSLDELWSVPTGMLADGKPPLA